MWLLVTGVPGTGKTTHAKLLAEKFSFTLINDLEFCKKHSLGVLNSAKELEVDLSLLQEKINSLYKTSGSENYLFEGHLWLEIMVPVKVVLLLHAVPLTLEARLKERNYNDEKILDNIHCEETSYFQNKLLKNYSKSKLFEFDTSNNNIKESSSQIISLLGDLKWVKLQSF
ncbi:MAG: AAA family ATPase [archaeon]